MNASRRRFILVDPCLAGTASHPFQYALEVLGAASRAGCECEVFGHRSFAAACPATWRVVPAFTHTGYSRYTAFARLDRLDPRGRMPLVRRLAWPARHAARRRAERIAAFAAEVRPVVADARPGDVVLVGTAGEIELAGLARAIAAVRPPRGVGWHALLHFPIYRGFTADFPRQDAALGDVAALLAEATRGPDPVVLHAVTPELAAEYARLAGHAIDVLPFPVAIVPPPRESRAAGPLRVACLGEPRPEKNSDVIARVVAAAVGLEDLRSTVRFVVQDAARREGRPPRGQGPVHRALAELSRASAGGGPVDLIPGPLDPNCYARELAAADVVLLPYDQDRYRSRCSAILLETIRAAAVPVVTGGGWMARQVAGPLARHAADVAARATEHDRLRVVLPRITSRHPLERELTAGEAGGSELVAVEARFAARADAALTAPPMRVEVVGAPTRPATAVAADPDGRAVVALFPLGAPGPCRVRCSVPDGATVTCEEIIVRRLTTPRPEAAGAGAVVIDDPRDAVGAVREILRHAAHYRGCAAGLWTEVGRGCSGDDVVRRLLS